MGLFSFFRNIFGGADEKIEAPVVAQPNTRSPMFSEERRQRPRRDARDGTRALVIDDSKTVVAALNKFLRSAGYVTFEALDAEAGLELARNQRPEIIFLDIVLPGMNGFSALRMLRKEPGTRDIPVIMMSGNEQATEQFFGSRIGADDFMKKPFSRAEIFARIERLLDEQRVPRRRNVAAARAQASDPAVSAAP